MIRLDRGEGGIPLHWFRPGASLTEQTVSYFPEEGTSDKPQTGDQKQKADGL